MLNDEKKTFEKKIDAVDSTVKENVKSMEEVFKFSVSFEIFRGVWAKFRIPPLRSVMFAIEHEITQSELNDFTMNLYHTQFSIIY